MAFFATPERAIEAACMLIDAGLEVFGIGACPLADSITKAEIAKTYDLGLPAAKLALRSHDADRKAFARLATA